MANWSRGVDITTSCSAISSTRAVWPRLPGRREWEPHRVAWPQCTHGGHVFSMPHRRAHAHSEYSVGMAHVELLIQILHPHESSAPTAKEGDVLRQATECRLAGAKPAI